MIDREKIALDAVSGLNNIRVTHHQQIRASQGITSEAPFHVWVPKHPICTSATGVIEKVGTEAETTSGAIGVPLAASNVALVCHRAGEGLGGQVEHISWRMNAGVEKA